MTTKKRFTFLITQEQMVTLEQHIAVYGTSKQKFLEQSAQTELQEQTLHQSKRSNLDRQTFVRQNNASLKFVRREILMSEELHDTFMHYLKSNGILPKYFISRYIDRLQELFPIKE